MIKLRKPLMLKSKKGFDVYAVIIMIVGIWILAFVTISMFAKNNRLETQLGLGEKQLGLLSTYAAAEKALLFVDDSAKLAIEQAAYKYGKSGFYYSGAVCGSSGDFSYWANDTIIPADDCVPKTKQCYPDEPMLKWTLSTFFYYDLYDFISSFNSVSKIEIPFNYEQPFTVSPVVGRTEIVGISKEPVAITAPNVKYEVKPSFRESIARDVIGDGVSVVAVARQLAGEKEKDARSLVKAADGTGGLDWNEKFDYSKAESSCTYAIGSCACCETVETCEEGEDDPDTGEFVCKKKGTSEVPVDDGTEYRTVPYDSFDIPMSVKVNDPDSGTGHRQFFIYDEAAKKVVLKELEYKFAVNWVEDHPEDSSTSCLCGTGHPC